MSNNTTTQTSGHYCLCGCSQVITSKALYRPGHDAAHVSYLLQGLINQESDYGRESVTEDLILAQTKDLPSDALKAKYLRAAHRLFAAKPVKVNGKGKETETLLVVEGNEIIRWADRQDVKVGRWYYPAKDAWTEQGQIVLRNEKRDGTGNWVVFN